MPTGSITLNTPITIRQDTGAHAEDDWECDATRSEGKQPVQSQPLPRLTTSPPSRRSQQQDMRVQQAQQGTSSPPAVSQASSLQGSCLALIGEYIDDYYQAAGHVLSYLPPDNKATLLAIARRHDTLSDTLLEALADSDWRYLDISAPGGLRLTAEGVMKVLPRMPLLQAVDISGCPHLSTPSLLSFMAASCPQIKILRCGAHPDHPEGPACNTALTHSLPAVLPALIQPAVHEADSWEDAFPDEEPNNQTAIASCSHSEQHPPSSSQSPSSHGQNQTPTSSGGSQPHMHQLRRIVWPNVPTSITELAARQCPALYFITYKPTTQNQILKSAEGQQNSLLDPMTPMDDIWLANLPASAMEGCTCSTPHTVSRKHSIDNACLQQQKQQPHAHSHQHNTVSAAPIRQQGTRHSSGVINHNLHADGGVSNNESQGSNEEQPSGHLRRPIDSDDEDWIPISVRFRQAYIDRAERIKARDAKAAHVAKLRSLRASPALAAVSSWLDSF